MDKYPSEEEIKFLKKKQDIVFGKDLTHGQEALVAKWITPKLSKIHKKDSTSFLMFSSIYSLRKYERIGFVDSIQVFCWENEVSIIGAIYFLMGWDHAEIDRIKRLNIALSKENDLIYFNKFVQSHRDDFSKELYTTIIEIYESMRIDHDFSKYPKTFKKILENSFELIKKNVVNNIKEVLLPLDQYTINANQTTAEIDDMKEVISDKLDNPHTISRIMQNTHFLGYLKNDTIEITDDYRLIFSGHTAGFSVGYTDKAILLSLDRRSAIMELKSNLKILEKYKGIHANHNELTSLTRHLIEFIDQNKSHVNYIPYKTLAKKMGISKNKVKRYAKEFTGIDEKTFLEKFETLKTHTNL